MAYEVKLWLFDLSQGLAKAMSPALIGKQIDGIWHTSIVIFNKEHFFGGEGVSWVTKGNTMAGPTPFREIHLGYTDVDRETFYAYLNQLGKEEYKGSCYNLFEKNCNTFSNTVSIFLTGNPIPSFITNLVKEVEQTPMGALFKQYMDGFQVNMSPTSEFSLPEPSNPIPDPSRNMPYTIDVSHNSLFSALDAISTRCNQNANVVQLRSGIENSIKNSTSVFVSPDMLKFLCGLFFELSDKSEALQSLYILFQWLALQKGFQNTLDSNAPFTFLSSVIRPDSLKLRIPTLRLLVNLSSDLPIASHVCQHTDVCQLIADSFPPADQAECTELGFKIICNFLFPGVRFPGLADNLSLISSCVDFISSKEPNESHLTTAIRYLLASTRSDIECKQLVGSLLSDININPPKSAIPHWRQLQKDLNL